MKYLAVLNSTAFEVLFRTARWTTIVACHSSHNKLCYVTVTPGQPHDVSHQRRPIHAHIASAKRFLLLKKSAGKSDWMRGGNHKMVLNAFTMQIMCFDENIIVMDY